MRDGIHNSGKDPGAGFTLIEVLMVIVLLGIVGTTILLFFAGTGQAPNATLTTQATMLVEEKLEEIIADKKNGGFASIAAVAPAALPAPFDRFTRQVEVICVDEADLDASGGTMPNCTDSDILAKRVRVEVSWAGGSVDLVTVISDH